MWGGGGFYPLLPWSSIVLESVPEAALVAARSRAPGAAAPPRGGPPTAEDARAAKVGRWPWAGARLAQARPPRIQPAPMCGGAPAPS
jgi:hypothetical protein